MKKMIITVNGQKYDVEVELVEDTEVQEQLPPLFNPNLHNHSQHHGNLTEGGESAGLPNIYKPQQKLADKNKLVSPVAGTVLEIHATTGAHLQEKSLAVVIEAMKMKTNVYTSADGKVKSIEIKVGDTVEQGQTLLTYEE